MNERARLRARRTDIEEKRVKVYEPHLRASDPGLFEDHEKWDFTRSRLADYRRVLVGLRRAVRDAAHEPVHIRETMAAPPLVSRSDRRNRMLRNIAVAASRSAFGHLAPKPAPLEPAQSKSQRKIDLFS
ncbi:MAG: hypothetical protein EXS17_02000 [Phycisphaerales bacterium]|nr:hypothetical protein [Phycisphaerales bacterium]